MCVNVSSTDFSELEENFDLMEPSISGLCNKYNESCCSCFKQKTCKDTGCNSHFEGLGKM